jgi:hypothetical protein
LDARILDFGCEKVLPVASLKNSNVALDKPKWYQKPTAESANPCSSEDWVETPS